MDFMSMLEQNQKSVTENGAIGYQTTGHKLVDLNFAIPSYRNGIDGDLFEQALKQDEKLTLKWLLYLRDIRHGVGERSSFRSFIKYLAKINHQLAKKFLEIVHIEEYGRWDDYIALLDIKDEEIYKIVSNKIQSQFFLDVRRISDNEPISLLAKWLPSENASSPQTKKKAQEVRKILGLSSKAYRQCLSQFRKYLNVVEVKMSANKWDSIDYASVPSKANLIYSDAFMKHDNSRRQEYLDLLTKGETKINANALFLHDIVHKYCNDFAFCFGFENIELDETLEQMWEVQDKIDGFSNTLVVRDGSGSMNWSMDSSTVSALDIADAITLYCAENNQGDFKDKFVTFSSRAKLVDISNEKTLRDKLVRLHKENDCSNTNIENVFELVLDTALQNNLRQEDMPKTILIVSDMEFDTCHTRNLQSLFRNISKKYSENGYMLPKLVFWNVNSRTNTIPLTQNENGVILLSGFSKNLMEMVMSSELDPYKALTKVLEQPRYAVIDSIYA